MFTHYKDMQSDKKCKNGVIWGVRTSATQPFDRAHTTSYSTLIETMCLLYRFRVIASYLSKVTNFNPPNLHLLLR